MKLRITRVFRDDELIQAIEEEVASFVIELTAREAHLNRSYSSLPELDVVYRAENGEATSEQDEPERDHPASAVGAG